MTTTQFARGRSAARFGPGFDRTFPNDRTTLGLFFPIEAFDGPRPTMEGQVELAEEAERLGFSTLWARDVPLDDPSFGDLGQIYDPFVWLATVAAHTSEIALATGSIILPLHHPIDVAKQAASLDHLSKGRLVLGIASGDRPIEYPAYGRNRSERADLFRDALLYLQALLGTPFPTYDSKRYGRRAGCSESSLSSSPSWFCCRRRRRSLHGFTPFLRQPDAYSAKVSARAQAAECNKAQVRHIRSRTRNAQDAEVA